MKIKHVCSVLAVTSMLTVSAYPSLSQALPVDLTPWMAESYPAVSGFGAGAWTVAADGNSVYQSVNGQPTIFYSDFNTINSDITGAINSGGGDNDYIGFALGFLPGDTSNATADYLLVDWKSGTQSFDFGAPSDTTPGSTAYAGLAVSRVTGLPTADEFWGHLNFAQDAGGGVEELARGNTLGSTGWVPDESYDFRFVFQSNLLQVYVNGVLEIDINGSFSDGRLAFYNSSQAGVTYSAFDVDPAPPVPIPAAAWLFGSGLLGMIGVARRRAS